MGCDQIGRLRSQNSPIESPETQQESKVHNDPLKQNCKKSQFEYIILKSFMFSFVYHFERNQKQPVNTF